MGINKPSDITRNKILQKKLYKILMVVGSYKVNTGKNTIISSYSNNDSFILDCYGEKFKNLCYNIGLTDEDYNTIKMADVKNINIGYIAATYIQKFIKNDSQNISILYNSLSNPPSNISADMYKELFFHLIENVKLDLITSAKNNKITSFSKTHIIKIGKILNKDINETKILLESLDLASKFNKILERIKNKEETTSRLTTLVKILILKKNSITVDEFINIMLKSNYTEEECDKFINKLIKKIPYELD